MYKPQYEASWALIIGIDQYNHAARLAHAVRDADAVGDVLQKSFGFPQPNITTLRDDEATQAAIRAAYCRYADGLTGSDDRLFVFFAGHGETRSGHRGDVGYLVPVDGDNRDLATLIPWDDLTRGADLIPAKHVLFVMDACYGGLALTRAVPPGSSRFARDMLTRFSRQVLAAGKGDQAVADAGGPRAGHSIFTGHFLEVLEAGPSSDGTLSANEVMAYVYERVGNDPHSRQTPHFGFVAGDGDFMFALPGGTGAAGGEATTTNDVLVAVPAYQLAAGTGGDLAELVRLVKELVADPRGRIQLYDLVAEEVRAALHKLQDQRFAADRSPRSGEEIAERLTAYEDAIRRLIAVVVLLARWGADDNRAALEGIVTRLSDAIRTTSGPVFGVALQWFPLLCVQYAGGIAAIAGGDYANLASLLTVPVGSLHAGGQSRPAVQKIYRGIADLDSQGAFKVMPGYERFLYPRSEYMFTRVQPWVEDLLFLGLSYEEMFDRFEILWALLYADAVSREGGGVWGPPGRFAWKFERETGGGPYGVLVDEATKAGPKWPPAAAGLFGGSTDRMISLSQTYRTEVLQRLPHF